jgi:hypothetical protein
MIMFRPNLDTRCEALFASDLQPSQYLESQQIRAAIMHMIRLVGARDCAARVAQEFGDHPDTAVTRMQWARQAVSRAYADVAREWSALTGINPIATSA